MAKILVVEDEYNIRELLQNYLENEGYFAWIKHVLGFEAGLSAAQILFGSNRQFGRKYRPCSPPNPGSKLYSGPG